MSSKVDPAVLKALSLSSASVSHASSTKFSSSCRLTAVVDEKTKHFFMKTIQGGEEDDMFLGEHESLNAIHAIVPSLCPCSLAHGCLSASQGSFLVTQYINFSSSSSSSDALSVAQKLAKLHCTPAPVPEGYSAPQFGFHVPTYCGSTKQDNSFTSSWADFYIHRRLLPILKAGETENGTDAELSSLLHQIVSKVVPRLLGDATLKSGQPECEGQPIRSVLVHGDLWSGNFNTGVIEDADEGERPARGAEEVIYDPCACYAHSEYELGIMKMFGGFGAKFHEEYLRIRGKDQPEEEWEDRVDLYELYHQMNHYAIFGGGYRSGAASIMKKLLRKYGDGP